MILNFLCHLEIDIKNRGNVICSLYCGKHDLILFFWYFLSAICHPSMGYPCSEIFCVYYRAPLWWSACYQLGH